MAIRAAPGWPHYQNAVAYRYYWGVASVRCFHAKLYMPGTEANWVPVNLKLPS